MPQCYLSLCTSATQLLARVTMRPPRFLQVSRVFNIVYDVLRFCSFALECGAQLSRSKIQNKDLVVWRHEDVALMKVALQDACSMDPGHS